MCMYFLTFLKNTKNTVRSLHSSLFLASQAKQDSGQTEENGEEVYESLHSSSSLVTLYISIHCMRILFYIYTPNHEYSWEEQ